MLSIQSVDSSPAARGVHRGQPSYFRAACFAAAHGVGRGYFDVGRTLAGSLASEIPHDIEDPEWRPEVELLEDLIERRAADEAIWQWFKDRFPRCMALVPTRRRDHFVAGVKVAYLEDGFGF